MKTLNKMETQKSNIFIVDDNKLMDISLKHYLEEEFGESVTISIFYDGKSCLEKIDNNTNFVILDYFLDSKNKNAVTGLEVLKEIKKINPQTEVIMFTCNEDIENATKSYRAGATDYVVKGYKAWERIVSLIKKNIANQDKNLVS